MILGRGDRKTAMKCVANVQTAKRVWADVTFTPWIRPFMRKVC